MPTRSSPSVWIRATARLSRLRISAGNASISAATVAFRGALDEGEHVAALIRLAVAGLVIVFSLWWLYFDRSAHNLLNSLRTSILWGYGHYFIFASAAAVGAGLGVSVDHAAHHTERRRIARSKHSKIKGSQAKPMTTVCPAVSRCSSHLPKSM